MFRNWVPNALLGLALLLAACGAPAPPAGTPAGSPAALQPAAAPVAPAPTATPVPTAAPAAPQGPTATPPPAATPLAAPPAPVRLELVKGRTEARFLVQEQLVRLPLPSEAVGATKEISGALTLGANSEVLREQSTFVVDLRTLQTDQPLRDRFIKQNTIETEKFPYAGFTATEARGLPVPAPTSGVLKFELVGDMTLHGVTKPVRWNVIAQFIGQDLIGRATTSFQFGDFGMRIPVVASVLSVEDRIRVEVDFTARHSPPPAARGAPTSQPPGPVAAAPLPPTQPAPAAPVAAAPGPAPVQPAKLPALQEYPVPPGSGPHDVAPAPDGGVWYTAQRTGELGWLDPATGRTRHIKLGTGSAPHGVIVGPDGAAWVTDSGLNAIVRVDAKTDAVRVFPLPPGRGYANLNTATFDRRGILWFTGQSGVYGRLDLATGKVDVYDAPRGRGPYGIATAPDGTVYYASLAGSYVGRVHLDTGATTVLEPPTPRQGARRVWPDSRGRVWVSEWNSGQMSVYDPATGAWRTWRLPGDSPRTYAVYVDERDVVWLTDWGANALVSFDPGKEVFQSFPLPSYPSNVRQILGRPGEVWGAASGVDKLVVVRTSSF